MKIFRYLPPARIDCLENEEVCFSQPFRFNDPFDLRPVFSPHIKRAFVKQEARREHDQFEPLDKTLSRRQKRLAARKIIKKAIGGYLRYINEHLPELEDDNIKMFNRNLCVLCFSAVRDNLLMWAHYADSHKGFVLEFDTEDEKFKKLGMLREVKYDINRPIDCRDQAPKMEMFLCKSKDWEYEKEFRIIRVVSEHDRISTDDDPLVFFKMPRAYVKAVYLGNRMEKNDVKKILELFKGTDAQLFKTELHRQEFGLVFKLLK